jgi:hypothetical protein
MAAGRPVPASVDDGPPDADEAGGRSTGGSDGQSGRSPETLTGHIDAVLGDKSDRTRFLDADFGVVRELPVDETFEGLGTADETPETVVMDGELTQRVLDVAAQRGIDQIVAASTGEFVKQPTSVRVRTAEQLLAQNEA